MSRPSRAWYALGVNVHGAWIIFRKGRLSSVVSLWRVGQPFDQTLARVHAHPPHGLTQSGSATRPGSRIRGVLDEDLDREHEIFATRSVRIAVSGVVSPSTGLAPRNQARAMCSPSAPETWVQARCPERSHRLHGSGRGAAGDGAAGGVADPAGASASGPDLGAGGPSCVQPACNRWAIQDGA